MKRGRFTKLTQSGDKNFVEVLRHTFGALILLIIGTLVQFGFDLSLTHTFGAHGAGIFYLCFSVLLTLSLLGRLGIDRAVVRFIPPLIKSRPAEAVGIRRTAERLSLATTTPIAILLFILAPWVAGSIFGSSELTIYLRIFAFAIPPLALNYVYSGVLRAIKFSKRALSIERLTMYAIGIIAVLLLGNVYGLKAAMVGFVIAVYLSTLEGYFYIYRGMPSVKKPVSFNKRLLLITSAPLLFMVFATTMNGQASVLLMGAFRSNSEVAVFNIALRVSMLMNLILSAINVIAATQFSELYAGGKKKELQAIISKVSALGATIGLPAFIILAVFSGFWLSLFGHGFSTGSTALIILLAGQLFNVVTASSNYVLAMTGHERVLAIAVAVSLVINVIVGVILIPMLGVTGGAIANAATLTSANVIMLVLIKRYFGVWLLPFKYLRVWTRKLVS